MVGWKLTVYFRDTGLRRVDLTDIVKGDEISFITTEWPWVILSQLATRAILTEGKSDEIHLGFLAYLGNCPQIIRRIDNFRLAELPMMSVHDLGGKTIACHTMGIIELITAAIQLFINWYPERSKAMLVFAASPDSLPFCMRLNAAASTLTDSPDKTVRRASRSIVRRVGEFIRQHLARRHAPNQGNLMGVGAVARATACLRLVP